MSVVHAAAPVDGMRVLEDLNGMRRPHGLALHLRDLFGVSGAALNLEPWADEYVRRLRGYVDLWLATGRSEGVDTPLTRHPTFAISLIVERVVTTNKVLPATLKDGYVMAVVAVQHLGAGGDLAVQAAERTFTALLMSDWRLKIAKCVRPACGMYFRLGKWDHAYERGTRCPGCREAALQSAKQKRVEANRRQGKQALYVFVARRFKRRIKPGRAWYRDAALKAEIAGALNKHFRDDQLFRSLYPNAITGKWLEAGQRGRKNWLLIEGAMSAACKTGAAG
jgi:hypothetical protein